MRHGRLASAIALAAFTGLAAGQSPSQFGVDRDADAPAATAPAAARLLPGGPTYFGGGGPVDPYQFWVSAEYLWWRIKGDTVPPLVTTGPATFPVGFLGNAGTGVLLGGKLEDRTLTGVRLRAGMWLDECHTVGIEGGFFCLPRDTNSTTFSSAQFPVLARPFTDVNPGGPNSEFLAFPGLASGTVTVSNETKFCGANLGARCPLCANPCCCYEVDLVGGFQYLNLREQLTIVENPTGLPANPFPGAAGTTFIAVDQFKTRNQFYGGYVGLDARWYHGCWVLGAYATVGVGCNREEVEINGSQTAIPAGGTATTVPGGLLAVPGRNIGKFTHNETSYTSELGVTLGYQLTPNVQVFGGYTFLYWKNVVRPGSEIDPVLDVTRIPNFGGPPATSARPIVPFNQVDFWAQGVSAGVKLTW